MDRVDAPPGVRTVVAGAFTLTIVADGDAARATLSGGWARALPQVGGPREALLAPDGTAVLVDEWINVLPRHAVMIIAGDGRVVADIGAEAAIAAFGVPRSEVGRLARTGSVARSAGGARRARRPDRGGRADAVGRPRHRRSPALERNPIS